MWRRKGGEDELMIKNRAEGGGSEQRRERGNSRIGRMRGRWRRAIEKSSSAVKKR